MEKLTKSQKGVMLFWLLHFRLVTQKEYSHKILLR